MEKKNLKDLKVKSFVTVLENTRKNVVVGGRAAWSDPVEFCAE